MAIVKQLVIKQGSHVSNSINYILQDSKHLSNSVNYIFQDGKTESKLSSGINCSVETAEKEFLLTKKIFDKEDGIIAHHIIQSFAPGEVEPTTAHEIGIKLAESIAPGFQAVISTHIDKAHIHNHIIINSVNFEDGLKYNPDKEHYKYTKSENDRLAKEYNLSVVVPDPNRKGIDQATYNLAMQGKSWKAQLLSYIDEAIGNSKNMNDFIKYLESYGYSIKYQNVNISFKDPHHDKFIRAKTLAKEFGEEYSKESIERRIYEGLHEVESNRQRTTDEISKYVGNGINQNGYITEKSRSDAERNGSFKREFEKYSEQYEYNSAKSKAIALGKLFSDSGRKKQDDTLDQQMRMIAILINAYRKSKEKEKRKIKLEQSKNRNSYSVSQRTDSESKPNIIGTITYSELKGYDGDLKYLIVSKEKFENLKNSNIEFAAFEKESNRFNIAYKENDSDKIQELLKVKYKIHGTNINYKDLLELEGKTIYRVVSKDVLKKLFDSDLKYVAFKKNDGKYNIALKENDLAKLNLLMKGKIIKAK